MTPEQRQVRVAFPFELGRIPTYANTSLVSAVNGDFIINFGFINPLSVGNIQNTAQNETGEENSPQEVDILAAPVVSVALGRQTLTQLIVQIQDTLDNSQQF